MSSAHTPIARSQGSAEDQTATRAGQEWCASRGMPDSGPGMPLDQPRKIGSSLEHRYRTEILSPLPVPANVLDESELLRRMTRGFERLLTGKHQLPSMAVSAIITRYGKASKTHTPPGTSYPAILVTPGGVNRGEMKGAGGYRRNVSSRQASMYGSRDAIVRKVMSSSLLNALRTSAVTYATTPVSREQNISCFLELWTTYLA